MKGAIKWMGENHVAANLLMILIVLSGLIFVWTIKQEIFPEIPLDLVTVSVVYRGAAPEDIEESICVKIEEAISGVDGIDKISSIASEGVGIVTAELELGEDVKDVKERIKTEVDRIITFPGDAEKPVIKDLTRKIQVIQVGIFGDVSEKTLKKLAEKAKDDLVRIPEITIAEVTGVRNYEISVELSEDKLRSHGLSFDQISAAIKMGSIDLPGGQLKTKSGEIVIRTKNQGKTKEEYENIVIRSDPSGSSLKLKDIAVVKDDFEESDLVSFFDGKRAALIYVFRTGDQKPGKIAERVKEYVADQNETLPRAVRMVTWENRAKLLEARISLLLKNGLIGFMLVLISLSLFLEIRLALWVSSGILISFLGSFFIMKIFGVSINMISLFAFIIVLGIVVDDAIVVGENIFTHKMKGKEGADEASIAGALRVSTPVIFAVLTTVAAFGPLIFVEGTMGKVMSIIPVIVISVLLFSLLESLFILPAHLSTVDLNKKGPIINFFGSISNFMDEKLDLFIHGPYDRVLKKSVRNRYFTAAVSVAILLVSIGLWTGGIIKFNFFPVVEGDNMSVFIKMPVGTPLETTKSVVKKLEQSAEEVVGEYDRTHDFKGKSLLVHMYSTVGEQPTMKFGPNGKILTIADPTKAEIKIEMLPMDERKFTTAEVITRWRDRAGEIPGVESITFSGSLMSAGNDIELQLTAPDFEILRNAIEEIKTAIAEYDGVSDIKDSFEEGKYELKLKLKPEARSLGVTAADLARQVRQSYFGDEALRIQRGKDEIKVMLRYTEKERESLSSVERMRIRTKLGTEVPFQSVAEVTFGRGYSVINRRDKSRIITITADVDDSVANANDINKVLMAKIENEIMPNYPGLNFSYGGMPEQQRKSMKSLQRGFIIALFLIYLLLAVPFKSYFQPFIIMSAIPFGIIGAIWGHLIMGIPLTMIGILGIVALAGVVVNDSLVLVDFVNSRHWVEKMPMLKAVIAASKGRFRPIMLTSLTTFLGVSPMIFETDLQARFLIPMAVSLGFGIIFSTLITLILVPSGIMIVDDIVNLFKKEASYENR